MLYQIIDGTVSLGGVPVLSHIDFEIKGTEKIAVIGKNGAGKTSLLRLLAGDLELDRDDKREGVGVFASRKLTIGMLKQQSFTDTTRTVEEELLDGCPCKETYAIERFDYEREYTRLFLGFGFQPEDKKRLLSSFSGGEQTKIALIHLLLQKPDILLLDEPTNHLDVETVEWLETYLKQYNKAVVMVSHDRFFLDRVAEVVYEVSDGKLIRYSGNYTNYKIEKRKQIQIQKKAYERQQEEIKRLEELIERFKHKPSKAAFARSRRKIIERMPKIACPTESEEHIFTGELTPERQGSKWVFESEHLEIGYEKALLEITMRIRRGQKIGILGANGTGKTTFLKTIAGFLPPVKGKYSIGSQITIGYFDQHSAEITSEKTVAEHFHDMFPALTEKETRSILGAYLFGGREAGKQVNQLSGGEKARLVLAELLQSKPNFLILDEPTNHMDVQAKETLEAAFQAYTGTILFVSHDRYFIKQVADAILIFEDQSVLYHPFGYEHYLERSAASEQIHAEEQALIAGMRAVPKAERHRLKEIPTEEAYLDWQLRLATEKMEAAGVRLEEIVDKMQKMTETWGFSEAFWQGEEWPEEAEYAKLQQEQELRYKEWHETCLEWGELAFELPEYAHL